MSTRQYTTLAAGRAHQALADLGWIGWQPDGMSHSFAELFAYRQIPAPRPIQAEAIAAAAGVAAPALCILEAPTGIGKTETALAIADRWLQESGGRGLYIAMPTQATSNQMYQRVLDFLTQRYPNQLINVPLLHGQAQLDDQVQAIELRTIGEDPAARLVAMSWFTQKSKRALLAPFGVGTVDQALLSILQTSHFFVRLLGLSRKVIIFDEVHAYDTFMSTLFERLLGWLRAIGASVIILSATLPAITRQRLLKAYTGSALTPAESVVDGFPAPFPYPAVTLATAETYQPPQTFPLTPTPDYDLQLTWLTDRLPTTIAVHLQQQLQSGGCAAVICNTVSRAQAVYQAVRDSGFLVEEDVLILFHARYPPVWRAEIERLILRHFGRDGDRPSRAIVVATQVIEQSLDLDFDVLISDLAPIDLLLQRAGRLQRHERGPRRHPRTLTIAPPDSVEETGPVFGSDRFVYEPYILLETWLLLRERSNLRLPRETVTLIEAVYGPETAPDASPYERPSFDRFPDRFHPMLRNAYDDLRRAQHVARSKAQQQLVDPAHSKQLLRQTILGLEEDNPEVHTTMRALTRDIDPGISLILFRETEGRLHPLADPNAVYDLHEPPDRALLQTLAASQLTVQNWTLVSHFLQQPVPSNWRKNPWLRYAHPLILRNDMYHFETERRRITLRLTREMGLETIMEDK